MVIPANFFFYQTLNVSLCTDYIECPWNLKQTPVILNWKCNVWFAKPTHFCRFSILLRSNWTTFMHFLKSSHLSVFKPYNLFCNFTFTGTLSASSFLLFFVPKGPQESQEEDSRGSQLQCVLHVWAGSDPGIQRGESCSTNLYVADFTFGWGGLWKWCVYMHDSPPRRALRFKSVLSWKHTATHTHTHTKVFYFFFPLHPLLYSVFPFPLFIVAVCPPVSFPTPGLAAVRLVVCWYESGWWSDIQTVSSVIRLQINCWACPGCRRGAHMV